MRTTTLGPFGEVIRATGPMVKANPFRFSTKYQDDESDLVYYGYRYYKTTIGTWISRDKIGERGGQNVYSFLKNDPIIDCDINGNISVTRTPEGKLDTSCGSYVVFFNFVLEHPVQQDGYIVQKVTFRNNWTEYPKYGQPIKHEDKKIYWEAWLIRAKTSQTISTTQFPPRNAPHTDKASDVPHGCSSGWQSSVGEIKFYYQTTTGDLGDPGANPIVPPDSSTGWKAGSETDSYWGLLPHIGEFNGSPEPPFWKNAPDNKESSAARWVMAKWSCLGAIQTDGQVYAYPDAMPQGP